ncbi:hypothetical protein NM688_g119 [Phlebia brevispora]|uniref:Uncharacterized protein n=1 Tax=Phlebia brevispora TaxID=194682 RepID=A0ACC1TF51_9APHY|nr:hypothetical protein NM688_g119 [Phlebia brevispora]
MHSTALQLLPLDVLREIALSGLEKRDLRRCAMTCKALFLAVNPVAWKSLEYSVVWQQDHFFDLWERIAQLEYAKPLVEKLVLRTNAIRYPEFWGPVEENHTCSWTADGGQIKQLSLKDIDSYVYDDPLMVLELFQNLQDVSFANIEWHQDHEVRLLSPETLSYDLEPTLHRLDTVADCLPRCTGVDRLKWLNIVDEAIPAVRQTLSHNTTSLTVLHVGGYNDADVNADVWRTLHLETLTSLKHLQLSLSIGMDYGRVEFEYSVSTRITIIPLICEQLPEALESLVVVLRLTPWDEVHVHRILREISWTQLLQRQPSLPNLKDLAVLRAQWPIAHAGSTPTVGALPLDEECMEWPPYDEAIVRNALCD